VDRREDRLLREKAEVRLRVFSSKDDLRRVMAIPTGG
jgi:hypothetical protein